MRGKIGMWLGLVGIFLLIAVVVGCGGEAEAPAETKPAAAAEPEAPPKPAANSLEMVFVNAGEFQVGGPEDEPVTKFSSPVQTVKTGAFWIDRYEVTFEEYMEFVAETGYSAQGNWSDYYSLENASRPVFNVTVDDAKAFAEWKGKRLATQDEWEKAAAWDEVQKKQRRYPWGDEWKDSAANTAETTWGHPMDVGEYEGDVSFYGANDMLGNVYEWTDSFYTKYRGGKFNDPNFRLQLAVVKGAQFGVQGKVWWMGARSGFPKNAITGQGFRCVRDATPEEETQYTETVMSGTPVIQEWVKPADSGAE